MKKFTIGLAVLLLVLFVLSGCSLLDQNEVQEENPYRQINFYYPRDGNHILKRLILEYNQVQEDLHLQLQTQTPDQTQVPKPIRIEGIEGSGMREGFFEELEELIKAGETIPDVLLVHDTWLESLVADDRVLSLDGGFSESKKAAYFKGMAEGLTFNNKIYGVPFWQDLPLLYYRKDLMESPPVSWKELAQMANQISEENELEYGLVIPGAARENASAFLTTVWSYYGAQPDFSLKEITFDEGAMSEAWSSIKTMVDKGSLPQNTLSMSAEDSRGIFESGNAVFMWNWSYGARLLTDPESPISDKIGVTSLPVSDTEEGRGLLVSGYALVMSKSTGLLPEGWEFIQFLTDEASQRQLMDAGMLPAVKSLYQISWLNRAGLPPEVPYMLESGRTLKPGSHSDSTLTMMSQALTLAIGQNKDAKDLIQFIKEGILAEETEEPVIEEPVDEEPTEEEDEE